MSEVVCPQRLRAKLNEAASGLYIFVVREADQKELYANFGVCTDITKRWWRRITNSVQTPLEYRVLPWLPKSLPKFEDHADDMGRMSQLGINVQGRCDLGSSELAGRPNCGER